MIEAILFFLGMTVFGFVVLFFLIKNAGMDPYNHGPSVLKILGESHPGLIQKEAA